MRIRRGKQLNMKQNMLHTTVVKKKPHTLILFFFFLSVRPFTIGPHSDPTSLIRLRSCHQKFAIVIEPEYLSYCNSFGSKNHPSIHFLPLLWSWVLILLKVVIVAFKIINLVLNCRHTCR